MQNFLKKISLYAIALTLIGAGVAFAHGEDTPPETLHPVTQIGLPDAKAGHDHGGGGAHGAHGGSANLSANFDVRIDPAGPYPANTPLMLRFTVLEKLAGRQIKSFDLTHTKPLHLIAVSPDLEEFYHMHPNLQTDGTFLLENFSFPREVLYVLYFDLAPTGAGNIVVEKDMQVGQGAFNLANLSPTRFPVIANGIELDVKSESGKLTNIGETNLVFSLADAQTRAPLTDIQAYLGAAAHLVMISQASLTYLHVHPLGEYPTDPAVLETLRFGPDIKFAASFPQEGLSKGWLQILRNNSPVYLPFVVNVEKGAGLIRNQVALLVHNTQKTEEARSMVKFAALSLLILGMIILFYPKKPIPTPQQAAPVAQPVAPESKAGMPYDPLE